jgi:hypothetical protein
VGGRVGIGPGFGGLLKGFLLPPQVPMGTTSYQVITRCIGIDLLADGVDAFVIWVSLDGGEYLVLHTRYGVLHQHNCEVDC